MPNDAAIVIEELLNRIKTLESRVRSIETYEFARLRTIQPASYLVNAASITAGNVLYTDNARDLTELPPNTKGVFISIRGTSSVAGNLYAATYTPDVYSQRIAFTAATTQSATMMINLDSNGKFYLKAETANFTNVYVSIIGYWI